MPSLHEEHKKGRVFLTRIIILASIQLLLFLILISRLFYLQIIKYDTFKSLSEDNRIKTTLIPPLRGNFYDRNGVKLTENISSYRILLYNQNKKNNKKALEKLTDLLNLSDRDVKKAKQKLIKNENRPIISLIDNLNWDELVKVEANSYRLNGVSMEKYYMRNYLNPTIFAHILGYISPPNDNELKTNSGTISELFLHPDFRVGRSGLEESLNKEIVGRSGSKRVEVNAFGVPVRDIEIKEARAGSDIKLTIDADVQNFIAEQMEGKNGSVVLMDVNTGEIISMVSTPSFNPNDFAFGISTEEWNTLNNDPKKPLMNKATNALYSPGSTFKLIVAISALENGWNKNTTVNCPGKIWQSNRYFHCWKGSGHEKINLEEAIMESCNIYFSKLGLFTGIDNIYDTATKFGLGQKFDINLNTKTGIVASREWKKEKLKDVWVRGDTVNTAIGQGFTIVSPLQLAVMVSRIANGGYPIEPFLIYDSIKRKENKLLFDNEPIVKSENIDLVKKAMYMVVNEKEGTSYWNRILEPQYTMAGKTGTTQLINRAKKEELESQEGGLEERFKNHGIFVAFAPYDKPKYGIAVVIENGGGGYIAVPIARDVLLYIQKKYDNSNL